MPARRVPAKIQQRPAETAGVASAIAFMICYLAGVDDPGVLAAIGTIVGFVPAVVTWIVVTVRAADDA
jgi:hypothetical protein